MTSDFLAGVSSKRGRLASRRRRRGRIDPGLPERLSAAEEALLDRRIVLVNGAVDEDKSAAIAASLIALEALGDEPVEMRISAESDSLDVALALIDTLDSLRVAVNGTVAGTVPLTSRAERLRACGGMRVFETSLTG